MAVLPRCIDILLNLFINVPDCIYNTDEMGKNIVSSLCSIFNLFSKIAGDPSTKNDFIFRSNADIFLSSNNSLKEETISDMCYSLVNLTDKLSFTDNIDNEISKITCAYLRSILSGNQIEDSIQTLFLNSPFYDKIFKLTAREDGPVIMYYLFCQILFAHSYRKKYCEDLSTKYSERLLFNKELDKYQFSLPYEDQVTCSYFVFRYIYLPEEREMHYTIEKNKYDCGFKSAKPMKYKFVEVKKRIDKINNQETYGDKTTSYDHFADRMIKLNLIKTKENKAKHYSLLKFYLLINVIKGRRDVVRSVKSDEKNGFDIIKMLESLDIENFIFDGLPYETANGYHSTILLSEIKKDIEFKDLVVLTSYYIKTMDYLHDTSNAFRVAVDKIIDGPLKIIIPNFQQKIRHITNLNFSKLQKILDKASFSDNVMLQALSLVYIQSIESCLLATNTALQYILKNMKVIALKKNVGIFSHPKWKTGIKFYKIESTYYDMCEVIGGFWPELLPPEDVMEKKFRKYYEIIKRIISESKTPSYNYGQCSSRFLVSMILVCLSADQGRFTNIPRPSYYHSGKNANISSLYDLLSTKKYSIFKHLLIPNLFEAQNECLSGKINNWKLSVKLLVQFNHEIKDTFIPTLKNNPIVGLEQLFFLSEYLYWCFNTLASDPSPLTKKQEET